MAATLANRTPLFRAIGLLRHSFSLVRALSAAPAPPPPSSAAGEAADPQKPKRKKKKNLFEVAQFLPNWGIGYKMAKNHWRDVSYEITKINLYKDGRHGKAWGIRHKSGLPVADAPIKISGVHKRGWRYIPQSKKKLMEAKRAEQQKLKKAEQQKLKEAKKVEQEAKRAEQQKLKDAKKVEQQMLKEAKKVEQPTAA